MALGYVPIDNALIFHRKTRKLANLLNQTPSATVGYLSQLWRFTMQSAPDDGDLSNFGFEVIAEAITWPGAPEVLRNALVTAGWLDCDGERLIVHHWSENYRLSIQRQEEKRADKAEYMRGFRAGQKAAADKLKAITDDEAADELAEVEPRATACSKSSATLGEGKGRMAPDDFELGELIRGDDHADE